MLLADKEEEHLNEIQKIEAEEEYEREVEIIEKAAGEVALDSSGAPALGLAVPTAVPAGMTQRGLPNIRHVLKQLSNDLLALRAVEGKKAMSAISNPLLAPPLPPSFPQLYNPMQVPRSKEDL